MGTSLDRAIARFRADPEMARYDTSEDVGGCWTTAYRFAWYPQRGAAAHGRVGAAHGGARRLCRCDTRRVS